MKSLADLRGMPPLDSVAGTKPSGKLEDRDFALYVDGQRIKANVAVTPIADGISLEVVFTTTRGALDDPTLEPAIEAAWGGWKPGDICHLRQPTSGAKYPSNGTVQIHSVRRPARAGDEAVFVSQALLPIYDYVIDREVAGAGEWLEIPVSWFQK